MVTKNHISIFVRCILFIAWIMGLVGLRPAQVVLAAGTIYVNQNATGFNDGTSWVDAYTNLQSALSAASSGDEIWVAAGTYEPTDTSDRTISFALPSGVKLYGGFNGTETAIDQRNPTTNISALSGDLGVEGDTSDNSYHVIHVESPGDPVLLDGFTVTGGNANGDTPYNHGGGIYHYEGTLSVVNTTLSSNYSVILPDVAGNGEGGAIYSTLGTLTISTSTFDSNTASRGGAIMCVGGTLNVTDSSFYSNSATSDSSGDGGAIYSNCNSTFANDTFDSNTADHYGGAILTDNDVNEVDIANSTFYGNSSLVGGGVANYGKLMITNSTFSHNSSPDGGAMKNGLGGTLSLRNSILANSVGGVDCSRSDTTPAIENINNLIETTGADLASCGVSLLTEDPTLASLADNGGATKTMALLLLSPAIGAGNNATCAPTDQRGVTRPQGQNCDLGAYEEEILPDLIIESITVTPASPQPNEDVTFSVVVKNQGPVDAGEFYLDLFIDSALPTSCGGIGTRYAEVTYLAAGVSQTITLNYAGFASDGTHTINGIVDTECEVDESDESNNTNTKTITVENPVPAVGTGIYDDSHSAWDYVGTWRTSSLSGPYNNTLHQTTTAGSYAEVTFTGTQVKLTYLKAPGRGSFDVYIDNFTTPVATINEYNSTTIWQATWTSQPLSDTTHTIRIQSLGNGWIDLDAIQVFGADTTPPPPGPGTYDDAHAGWSYSGSWSTWSGAGPIGNTMHYTNAAGATASFTFQGPAKFILYFQAAANRSNILVSVDGGTPVAVNAYSATSAWQRSYTSAMYSDTGSHTVTITTPGDGKYIDVDAIQIVAPPTPAGPGTYDDAHAGWSYSGSWSTWSGAGPLSNTMHYTNAAGATASFTFQGPAKFILYFQAAANRSNILVSVDGGTPVAVNAYSATSAWQRSYTSAMYSDTGTHTVTITTPGNGKYIDVDAIKIVSPSDLVAPAAISNLAAATGTSTGTVDLSWTAVGDDGSSGTTSSYLVRYSTSAIGDESAWTNAIAVTIGVPTPKAAGQAESMTVSGLVPGQTYYFAVRAQDEEPNLGGLSNSPSAVAKSPAPSGAGMYDDAHAGWSYSGSWSTWSGAGPIGNTMHYTNATGATASFTFQGPAKFILYFQAAANRSNILVSVDGGTPVAVNAYSATSAWQRSYTSAMYSDTGSHTVTISTPGDGKYIDIDAIQIVAPPSPAGPGTYDDAHAGWSYSGSWSTWSGAGPISNTMHYTNATGATASFTFQGPAKFILYFQAAANRSNILVSVDGGTPVAVNAYSATNAWQQMYTSPMYGTGTHTVTITTPGDGKYIDIDAIQIVP